MNKWRKRFDELGVKYGDTLQANDHKAEKVFWKTQNLVANIIKENNSKIIVDVGCGNGIFSKGISTQGNVYGVDFSFNMLLRAKNKGLRSVQADALHLSLKSVVSDTTLCMGMIQLLRSDVEIQTCFEELKRITKPGGLIIISTLNSESLLRRAYGLITKDIGIHFDRMFSINEIYNYFKSLNIEIEEICFFYTPLALWSKSSFPRIYQRFLASTFLIIGRKKYN